MLVIEDAEGSGGHAITGNVMRKSVYKGLRGVDLGDAVACSVQGNIFDGVAGEAVRGSGEGHVITGNVVRDATE